MRTQRRWIFGWLVWGLVFASCAQTQNNAPQYDPDLIFGYDKNLPLSAQENLVEETSQYTVYKVVYRSVRDQKVPAFFILPKNRAENEKVPCVILMHGLGGDKRMFQMMWGLLTQAGLALFAIDAQYHGDRKPEDNSPFFGMYPYRTRDALIQTVIDLRRGIDYLETRQEIDPKRIGYLGASMGGILGAIFAGVDERVQAPVLLVAGGDWKILMEKSSLSLWRDASKTSPDLVNNALKAMDVVDPIRWVGRISPRPVLMINGDADNVVPVDSNKALHNSARDPKTIVWYKGGHVPPPDQIPTVFTQITQWLNQHLKGQKSSALWWRDYLPRFQSPIDAVCWWRENQHLLFEFVHAFSANLTQFLPSFAR